MPIITVDTERKVEKGIIHLRDPYVNLLVEGKAGSGKNNFLNVVIQELCANYDERELNIFLADFKLVEFQRYLNPDLRSPLIKEVMCSENEIGLRSFLSLVEDQMFKRLDLFSKNRCANLWEYNAKFYAANSLPRVVVIMDSADYLLQNSRDCLKMMENVLKLNRSTGFNLIFSQSSRILPYWFYTKFFKTVKVNRGEATLAEVEEETFSVPLVR